ncbi:hypothetical protein FJT64_007012 [Amphibalanus amphitrite]|uniref:Uncharacterized protein n=1 Tax=Amphibalanus amphitrite TaxID=1232801 RepID=A0A6A4VMU0_AMPAM|nr:hypothetical protein FJT64_007012 [Amphibalanus amphitrite]
MPVIDSMMWRFSTLFNYIRGGVRSGAWRVRETPSQLLSDDREERDEQRSEEAAAGPRPRGRRAGPPPPPPPPPVRAAAPLAVSQRFRTLGRRRRAPGRVVSHNACVPGAYGGLVALPTAAWVD